MTWLASRHRCGPAGPLSKPATLAAVLLAGLGLAACDMRPSNPPKPQAGAATPAGPTSAVAPPPTVPSADSVLTSAPVASTPTPTGRRTNTDLSDAQESNAMPIPGQVNDHSSPVASAPARRAGTP